MCNSIRHQIKKDIKTLSALSNEELLENRYNRFRQFGYFTRTVDDEDEE